MNGFQDIHLCTLYQGANEGMLQKKERQTKKGKDLKSKKQRIQNRKRNMEFSER